jgi:hypothetical protein
MIYKHKNLKDKKNSKKKTKEEMGEEMKQLDIPLPS